MSFIYNVTRCKDRKNIRSYTAVLHRRQIVAFVKFVVAGDNQRLPKIIRSPIPKWMQRVTAISQITNVSGRKRIGFLSYFTEYHLLVLPFLN